MTCMIVGDEAKRIETLDTNTLKDEIQEVLFATYGSRRGFEKSDFRPKDVMVTNWGSDPYFQGSYTFFPVKAFSEEDSWDNYIKPVSCIHFGGEAFDEKYSGFI